MMKTKNRTSIAWTSSPDRLSRKGKPKADVLMAGVAADAAAIGTGGVADAADAVRAAVDIMVAGTGDGGKAVASCRLSVASESRAAGMRPFSVLAEASSDLHQESKP